MAPFTNLLKGHMYTNKTSIWNVPVDLNFTTLKEHVYKAPSLLLLDPSKPLWVENDASDYVVGHVIFYEDSKIVAFESKNIFIHLSVNIPFKKRNLS